MAMDKDKTESGTSANVTLSTSTICSSHDYETMRPIVMASWRLGLQTSSSGDKSGIVVESRVIREVIPIPNSRLSLVYHSGRARGYLSTIELRLTPEKVPSTLKTIQLRITIEGVLFEKTFEADPNLKFTYSWKRLNIYRQRVYGTTTAVVKVGYTYEGCEKTVWNVQATKISGQDLTVSDIGGWDLNLHHRYNPQEGILYRGDGSNVFLRERPRLIFDLMGDGKRRNVDCDDATCHVGPVEDQRLLSPVALAAASDGSIYVGDYNLIRRIRPDRVVTTVLKLKSSGMAYRYHLSVNSHDDVLYISDPESHRVIRVKNVEDPSDIENNFEVVVGSGIRCLPGDGDSCGDGGPAKDARLFYPKGIAISADRKLYLADGTTIRVVDEEGIIDTLIGSKFPEKLWKPMACGGTTRLEDAALRWPTEMAVNPLDNSLYFVDDGVVTKVTSDGRLQMVAGRPLHCRPSDGAAAAMGSFFNFASQSTLVSPTSISFSLQGDLYLAESDSRRINRISVVGTDGRIRVYAGKDSKCNCQDTDCVCYDKDVLLATETVFGSISSVTVSPDGRVYIADLAGRRVRVVESNIPALNADQEYEVYSPESQEVYIFNRFGLHSETKNIPSGKTVLKFSYSVSTSNGKLIGIEDASGGKVKIARDYSGQATSIENSLRQRFALQLDRKRMLTKFTRPDNSGVTFSYTRSSELIRARKESGDGGSSCVYEYDDNGRLVSAVTSSGDHFSLVADLDLRGAIVNVTLNGRENVVSLLMQPRLVQQLEGDSVRMDSDKSFVVETRWGRKIKIKTSTYPLLDDDQAAQSYPIPVSETTDIGRDSVSRYDWQYYVNQATGKVGKKLKVSGEPVIAVELNRQTESQVVMLESAQAMLNSSDSPTSLRINLLPSGLFAGVNVEKNRLGQPVLWRWGDLMAEFKYDSANRLTEFKAGANAAMTYVYKDDKCTEPEKVLMPSGGAFVYHRNELGGLEYVMTPRGHIHGFSSQYSLAIRRFIYSSPWSRQPYELHVDFSGRIVAKVYPHDKHKTVFSYNKSTGKLETAIGGTRSVDYKYYNDNGLLKTIKVSEDDLLFNLKIEMRYHLGVLKEQQIIFDRENKISLDQIVMRYTYDGNARLAGIVTQIGQQDNESVLYKYKSGGRLEAIKDLRIRYESFRRTVVEDSAKTYSYTKDLDSNGRLDVVVLRINGYETFRLKYSYDSSNRISSKTSTLGGSPVVTSFAYNVDGQLQSVKSDDGVDDWTFTHDVNGNVVGVKMADNRVNVGFDGGDRIVSYGDLDFVSYDDRGFVVRRGNQRYLYNAFGQMISAHEPGKFAVRFYYDDLGRIAAKRDHRGNVVQFVYSNPYSNSTVSHVHYPKAARTYHLIYDENDFLVAMDTPDSRYYIATDHLGSPIAVFDYKGKLVKEISRSPFGRVTRDTNPGMDIPIDFAGGLVDQYAHLIHIGGRVYDPLLGQWMTPTWEKVFDVSSKSPFDIFSYRFFRNDPVNPDRDFFHMTSLTDWLQLFGLNLPRMFGTEYTSWSHHKAELLRLPEVDISVGLANQQRLAVENLLNPSLLSNGLLTSETFSLPHLFTKISTKTSAFGRGLLLTDLAGKAVVTLVDDASDVVQSVFSSVLNATLVLDVSHSGKEEFSFLKPELSSFQTDYGEMQRLSGSYNVSYDGIRSTDGKELCATNRHSTVCIIYGIDKRAASRYVHRRAHKLAVMEAWKRETDLLKEPASAMISPWSPAERIELQQRGEVNGYTGVEIHSVHKFPALIGQSSNIKFVKDDEAKGWHNGNGNKARKHS